VFFFIIFFLFFSLPNLLWTLETQVFCSNC